MKRNIADDDSTTTSAQPTTLREADEGVVDGECHNLGLHGKQKFKFKNSFVVLTLF